MLDCSGCSGGGEGVQWSRGQFVCRGVVVCVLVEADVVVQRGEG